MNSHEKSKQIIEALRLTGEQIADILQVHTSTIVKKKAKNNYHKFNDSDFEKLKTFAESKINELQEIIK